MVELPWDPSEPTFKDNQSIFCTYLSNLSHSTFDTQCSSKLSSVCRIKPDFILRVYGLCEDSKLDSSFIVRNEETVFLLGQKSTRIQFYRDASQWRAVTKDGTLLASMNATESSFLLGTHNWTIYDDILKCQLQHGGNPYTISLSLNGCDDEEFNCDDGTCIALQKKCDGYQDCGDSSDETTCSLIKKQSSYSKRLAPQNLDKQHGHNIVNINLNIMEIIAVNEVDGNIRIKLNVTAEWKDPRLTFYNLKTDTTLNELEREEATYIWVPDILFMNIRAMEDKKIYTFAKTYIERNPIIAPLSRSKTALNTARKFMGNDSKIIFYEASRKIILIGTNRIKF